MRISKANLARLAKGQLPLPSEDDTQSVIIDGLRAYGYVVTITSRRVKKCWFCKAWPKSGHGDGASKGLSDLIVRHPTWPAGVCVSLEVKKPGPTRWTCNEQKLAAMVGDTVVVKSLEEALEATGAIRRVLDR